MTDKKARPSKYNPQPTSSKSTYILGGLAILVIAAVVIGGVFWQKSRSEPRADGYGTVQNADVQIAVLEQGIVSVGLPSATKTVDVYEDPMCPYCAELENTHGQELAQKIDAGAVTVRYHMLDFLNQLSASGDYSTRAVAASQCVAASESAVVYSKFHSTLFAPDFQPAEKGSSDHSNDDLAQLARDSGGSDASAQCITNGAQASSAASNAAAARQALAATGSSGTPTVVVDGGIVDALGNKNWVADL
ncbi:hypothetical protein GCM10007304_19980 [Rhodococcoides trifolii]|uniref:Thioredoxin-like fold domain-containing protein n=1 Tax=Rhodococcoides trifolii TaxID=908250 RepID=A0A917D2M7_9NOCA|nr:thioredoxin domain-containing protein [Rhodococcus trifolii]GGG05904.1 hypothetical protein GCM10007304_19980 [Rhodococcus trifolii]